jgi:hypothetical protein
MFAWSSGALGGSSQSDRGFIEHVIEDFGCEEVIAKAIMILD